ncbi:hypothetical protein GGC47_003593 [Bosea sp. OAE752]|jgi:hypothetical protein|uniref:hypothetical protein n=1 Tax=unclassified Bosea (in: a-proteobacteria) TaxID=2653178 RepID=UPI001152431F
MDNAHIDNLEGAGNGDSQTQSNPEIVPDVATGFTYASYQNAIPVIRSIRIANMSGRHFEGCRLDLTSTPSFLRLGRAHKRQAIRD